VFKLCAKINVARLMPIDPKVGILNDAPIRIPMKRDTIAKSVYCPMRVILGFVLYAMYIASDISMGIPSY
jgi:hypothetical protein